MLNVELRLGTGEQEYIFHVIRYLNLSRDPMSRLSTGLRATDLQL